MVEIRIDSLSVEHDGATTLHNINTCFNTGELVAIVGPNGAGKSTLLKSIVNLVQPSQGAVMFDGSNVSSLTPESRARRIGYLAQTRPLAWPMRVIDIINLGRYAYGGAVREPDRAGAAAVTKAMHDCGVTHLKNRRADTLSGGEMSRVHCARLFAAHTPFVLADEPTASLDPKGQLSVLNLLRSYAHNEGGGAVVVLHELQHAITYADRILWIRDGEIEDDGPPAKTATPKLIKRVFDVDAKVRETDGRRYIQITDHYA
ncbi:MAG: ABC transporter ATP-binding protein [Pseudomonadota bacterium]